MQRRQILPVLLAGMTTAPGRARATDEISRPPARRVFASVSGRFVLTLVAVPHGPGTLAEATLEDISADRRQRLWQRTLPQEDGPRTAVVSDSGAVLLVDEWINVVPRHALMLIGSDGRTIADYSGEQVFSRLAVPRGRITAEAREGVWRSSAPVLAAGGDAVRMRAGGRVVSVSFADGRLVID